MDITAPPSGRTRLLAFDGGGIRGLFSLEIAKRLETLLREKHGRPDMVLADHFHYIGGTSTGAIIATFLSWGVPVEEVIRLYRENSKVMFTRAGWGAFFKNRFAGKPISDFLRNFFVESDGSPATLGTDRLRTLLLVVTRNASTGSPWPMSNNPHALYNDRSKPGCNLDLPLWQIVRASTAAPTFFPPEVIEIADQQSGEAKKHIFAFEDGGVTPFNNPAHLLYTMATLPEYRLGWPDGADRMSLVSVGTGRVKTGRGQHLVQNLLGHAKSLPTALIGSAQWLQDLICRQQGECRHGEPLDGEIGDLIRPNPRAAFRYARYDRSIGEAEMQAALKVSKRGFSLDNIELMGFLSDMGTEYAEQHVKLEHFDDV
ncbi:patatin-like phospholipase family protein [Haloferula sp. BvORR071]|uniref:patatin-like phospholipase family protein n=1 Tax=Haloferula sp. BvORR071 TaxID=1396141 RepID=UPI000550528D|nr:patatin-like phospholipase family protein [Haloferula sp. BvORR071]